MSINYSAQQESIFAWVAQCAKNVYRNLVVGALAGTGKTFTMIHALKHFAPDLSILVAAFNKSIKVEFSAKVAKLYASKERQQEWEAKGWKVVQVYEGTVTLETPERDERGRFKTVRERIDCPVDITTWHSYGLKLVTRHFGYTRINSWRAYALAYNQVAPHFELPVPRPKGKVRVPRLAGKIITLVKNLHSKGRSINPHATVDDLIELAFRFDCAPDHNMEAEGWDVTRVAQLAHSAMKEAALGPDERSGGCIDFDDMIYLPVVNGLVTHSHDVVMVDENQDMNAPMLEMSKAAARYTLILVGDRNQAIYEFRGADSQFADDMLSHPDTKLLTLTSTFRCGKAIVDVARGLVPTYDAHEDNHEGSVEYISTSQTHDELLDCVSIGDVILSRYNAPLVHLVLSFIKRGIPAVMKGNDFCKAVAELIKRLANGDNISLAQLFERLNTWEDEQSERIIASVPEPDSLLDHMRDKADTIRALAEDATTVKDLLSTLDEIFAEINAKRCITLSSVHRAKGLEWPKVFVLCHTLRHAEGRQEERNIAYVALTRAIETLVFVNGCEGMFNVGDFERDVA